MGGTYLSVEKAIEQRHKESLEWGEKMGRVGPDSELDGWTIQRRLDHHQGIGDTQQR